MVIKFDSLNRFEVPNIFVCSPGCKYTNGRLTNSSGALASFSDLEIIFNFNTVSQLSVRVFKVPYEDPVINEYENNLYQSLCNKRLLFVETIGFFVISQVTTGINSDGLFYKDITAESCEAEIQNRGLPLIENGTYNFTELFDKLVSQLPIWQPGTVISPDVAGRYRTFEDVDINSNILSFMLNDMQEAYECLFVFDIVNRTINVYDQSNYYVQTSIHITKDDLVNTLEIEENADDLYTVLSVKGADDLSVNAVNPLGTSTIYNFNYYLSWMSPVLREKVRTWQDLVKSYSDTYYQQNKDYYEILTRKSILTSNKSAVVTQLTQYKRCKENIIAEANIEDLEEYNTTILDASGTKLVGSYNTAILAAGGEPIDAEGHDITTIMAQINRLIAECEAKIEDYDAELNTINESLSAMNVTVEEINAAVRIQDYFSEDEWDELSNYMFEGEYTDEYITVLESMSQADRFDQMKILYDRGVAQLENISKPTQQFSLDVENFIFVKEFAEWSAQLETGCLINVELDDDDIAPLFLSNMTVNYEDKSLNMTFGNRFNKFDPKSLYVDALGQISRNTNTLSYIKNVVYPIKNGVGNLVKEALEESRNLTKDNVFASTSESVLIDDTGYTGRSVKPDGSYDPRQIKINGRNIIFTDDAWETCKTAIGEIILGDGSSAYGINSEILIGQLIIGNQLQILNNEGRNLLTVIDDINNQYTDITGNLAVTQSGIEERFAALDGQYNNLSAYIRTGVVGTDKAGKPIIGVSIGEQNISDGEGDDEQVSNFSSIFTSDQIGFYEGGDKTAYLSNKKLNVNTLRTTGLQLANGLETEEDGSERNQWEMGVDENSGFYLKWIGE